VREALFAILGSSMSFSGVAVLDLYAGTGALAFEALSRGAGTATLVESRQPAIRAIETNARALGVAGKVELIEGAVERSGGAVRARGPFDLIFADPPYADIASGAAVRAIAAILVGERDERCLLADDGRLVVEHAKGDGPPDLPRVTLIDTRRYGDTSISFYSPASALGGDEGVPRQR
jgi:16S rRNA (guanine966-N2)-methyltransferase